MERALHQIESPTANLDRLLNLRRPMMTGMLAIAVFIAVFVLWGSFVPLSTAAIATGVVSVEGHRRQVQHQSGGVVGEIHVRDGDRVTAGQLLLSLRDQDLDARAAELMQRRAQAEAELARWQAEQEDRGELEVPVLESLERGALEQAVMTQQSILATRRKVMFDALNALQLQREDIEENVDNARRRLNTLGNKWTLLQQELDKHNRLADEGLVTRSQQFELNTQLANLRLDMDENRAVVNGASQRLAVVDAEQTALYSEQARDIAENLTRARNQVDELRIQQQALDRRRAGLEIISPSEGMVFNSTVNTVGSVIEPGRTVMEIIPGGEQLLVESRVEARDRDSVAVGQHAEVRFSAFNQRATQPVPGVVRMIAADAENDPLDGRSYYRTRIELQQNPAEVLGGAEIHPGMQADVLIVTGEQTLLDYLMSPLSRSFNRALREN